MLYMYSGGFDARPETAAQGREAARGPGSKDRPDQEPLREARDSGVPGGSGGLPAGHRSAREEPSRHPHRGSGAAAWLGRLSSTRLLSKSSLASTNRSSGESSDI